MKMTIRALAGVAILAGACVLQDRPPQTAPPTPQDKQQKATIDARPRTPVSVFFVRHAETDDTPKRELSAAGRQRAADLARLLGKASITHVFTSEYDRTRQTAAPLAAATGCAARVVPARDGRQLVKALRALPEGSVAVVCGHSNTIPSLLSRLGVTLRDLDGKGHIAESAHDRLFLLTLGDPRRTLPKCVELRY